MNRSKAFLLVVLIALLAACQSPPRPASSPGAEDATTRAARALNAGRYIEAIELYREALGESPENVGLHYGLGVASSHVDRRDDAVREFRWVVQYGPPKASEVEAARQWLIRAGALPPVLATASTPSRADREPQAGNASLEGRAVYAQAGQAPQPMPRLQLFLVGQPDSPTKEERYNLRTDENGNFKFPDVVPGAYKLTNRVAGSPIWRLRVQLKSSETKVLELTQSNSLASQDDFPEPQTAAAKE
jgi:tetratricopeptide (TPR) repeat protein